MTCKDLFQRLIGAIPSRFWMSLSPTSQDDYLIPLAILKSLTHLDVSYTNFSGRLPNSIGNLKSLMKLYIQHCKFIGSVHASIGNLTQLTQLDLSFNNFTGNIPSSLSNLHHLIDLDLSVNNFIGEIPENFVNLTQLESLDLSSNQLSGLIPSFLSELRSIKYFFLKRLDLSDNKIHGTIPNWMGDMRKDNFYHLNLSHNFLTGGIEQLLILNDLRILDLHSNLLQGKLPILPPRLYSLLISNNQLTGEIPHYICNMSYLEVLDLSNNNMSGTIPECMGNISYLKVIDLQHNSFSGTIPDTFEQNNYLETLNFNNNDLEGPVPRSLVKCIALQVLDLGNNKINDTFPHWLGTLPELQVLVLRSNKFSGSVRDSKAKNSFSKLRILDLSKNNFSGSLPIKYFGKLKAMMNVSEAGGKLQYMDMGDSSYQYSVVVTMKGVDIHMEKILTIFTTMDFSSNKFLGQIPDVVGKLKFLKVLNFSHNDLIGHIPLSFENLTELESLDLSSNRLEGEIPKQLTSLTYLSALNLSYNRLVGHIPQGKQFGTFQNDSYIGNLGLCDFPLSEKCNNCEEPECKPDTPTIFHDEHDTTSWFDWKMSLMGYGCGLVIGLSTGYIVFSTGKPEWIVSMVDRKYSRKVGRLTGRRRRRN